MEDLSTLADDGDSNLTPVTVPDTPTARKESAKGAIDYLQHARQYIEELRERNTFVASRLAAKLNRVVLTMDSWRRCEPTATVRFATFTELGERCVQAEAYLRGER